jgi:hypothetical protein
MAVRVDASGDYLRRTTGLIDFQQPYTVVFWYSLAVNTAAGYQGVLTISSGGSSYDELHLDASGNLALECSGNSPTNITGRLLQADRWQHIAIVRRSQTLMEVYVDGTLDITNTANVSARNPATAANLSFGTNAFSEWTNARFTNAKAWQFALSRAEIIAERTEFSFLRQANIHAWWPMLPGVRSVDWSGNARPLTEGGTLTDEAGPLPVGLPLWYLPFAVAGSGVTVTPTAASVAATAVAPTTILGALTIVPTKGTAVATAVAPTIVLGAITLTPTKATVAATAVAPTVVLGALTIVPTKGTAVATAVAPTVALGALTITPTAASVASSAVAPTVIAGAAIVPGAASVAAIAVAPTTILGPITIAPAAASATASAVAPTVSAGAAITPAAASVTASAVAPTVILGASTTTPAPASVVASAIAPSVMITVIISAILLTARTRNPNVTARRVLGLSVDRDFDVSFRGG